MTKRCRVSIILCALVLAATAAPAQQIGRTATETVATVRDRDHPGAPPVSERVTRISQGTDREEVVVETYSQTMSVGRLALSQRIRRVTTATSDGSQTVEEIEEPPAGSPYQPLRVVRRSETTVRRTGPDADVTEQRVFERDQNGRFALVQMRVERTSRK